MSLREWLKKNEIFDRDILEILGTQYKVKDPYNDFANISDKEWKKFAKSIKLQKKQELKDNKTFFRFEKKIAKIQKHWKKQQKKGRKNAAVIKTDNDEHDKNNENISKQSNLKPNKKKKGKTTKAKNENKNLKDLPLTNPYHIKMIILNWTRKNKIKSKKINLYVTISRFLPTSGYGKDGALIVKQKKELILRSDKEYDFKSITLKKNAVLTVDRWETKGKLQEYNDLRGGGGKLILKCSGTITMHEGSKITVRAKGYPGGHGRGVKGGKGMGLKDLGGGGGDWVSAAGGKYPGFDKPINSIDDLCLGSGGGGITGAGNRFFPGGSGGGILIIECNKIIMKGGGCQISSSGETSSHGGGGSGGSLWLKCISLKMLKSSKKPYKILCKGGKGDGDEYSKGGENANDGKIRIDVLDDGDKERVKKNIYCDKIQYGNFE